MSKTGPIIIIDDDPDDHEMIERILSRLNLDNERKKFYDGEEALQYFLNTQERPMLVLCDINMPLMNGLELKRTIESNESLRKKRLPFVFLTTTTNPDQIATAYQLSIHGFFIKGQSYDELKETLIQVVSYWRKSEHPR